MQTFPVDRKHSDCSKALRNPQKVDLCVLVSFSCRVYAETLRPKVRPVADLGRFRIRSRNQRTNPDLIPDLESCVVESDLESESCRFESDSDS